MEYNVTDLVKKVRIALDQNLSDSALEDFSASTALSLESLIESKLSDAARVISKNAPAPLLDGGEAFGESIGWFSRPGYGGGEIDLPTDFLRLVVFQMNDWSRPVYHAIDEKSPEYALQSSRYPGVRGSVQRPVVAIVQKPIGLVLDFYSCETGENAAIKLARYIPIPKIESGKIWFSEKLESAVIYYTAYLTALALQDPSAEALLTISKELLQ